MDLLVAGNQFGDIYKLLVNDGNGNFVRATTALDGIARNTSDGNNMRPQILPVDFDQDGCTDVIVSSSGTPARPSVVRPVSVAISAVKSRT